MAGTWPCKTATPSKPFQCGRTSVLRVAFRRRGWFRPSDQHLRTLGYRACVPRSSTARWIGAGAGVETAGTPGGAADRTESVCRSLAINTGHMGFLAETSCMRLGRGPTQLQAGRWSVEERTMLVVKRELPGEQRRWQVLCLNEMAPGTGSPLHQHVSLSNCHRVAMLPVDISGRWGLILSRRQAATAYALSPVGR